MEFVADLHVHSKYARAVSPTMDLPMIRAMAIQKGIHLAAIPDWTHPLWMKEIEWHIEEAGEGVYRLKSQISNDKFQINTNEQREPLFVFSTEIACIYKQGEKVRRIHNLVLAPSIATAQKINKVLIAKGCNLSSDGRPIIGLSSKELIELVLSLDERVMLIPCHIWTPHFGVYGSASGFDSLAEAFGELAEYIYGIETGLSSDPEMNWQVEELLTRSILSFSDAHSPAKMGREATVFELSEPSFENLRTAISGPVIASRAKQSFHTDKIATLPLAPRNDNRIIYTIEFYPEEGKYHFSGHRKCNVVEGPEEIKTNGSTCPVCKRRLTEGVLYRVQQLSNESLLDRVEGKMSPAKLKWYTDKRHIHPSYVKLVPLLEIIAESLRSTVASQKVKSLYAVLTNTLGGEFSILLKTPLDEIEHVGGPKIADGIAQIRQGILTIDPGYDGIYGKVSIWPHTEKRTTKKAITQEDTSQLGLL